MSRPERISEQQRRDAHAGITVSQAALRALADDDEDAVLEAIQAASLGELRYASRVLLSGLWQTLLLLCDHDKDKARQALRSGADGLEGDRAALEAYLIVNSAEASDG